MPDKPFFAYFAPGATHAPHHVPIEWSDKYKGRFDKGWDALREETFARQKELGVIPPEAELTERPEEIPAWDDMPDDLKPVLARQMEVYAGFLEHTDHHVGRLVDALEDLEVLDDTLIYYIVGDNGASARGDAAGHVQRDDLAERGGRHRDDRVHGRRGSTSSARSRPTTTTRSAGRTRWTRPYQWTKQVASHWGGTRNGTVVHWPNGFSARGEVRAQFSHVIDIAATVLDAAGLPAPTFVHGVQQMPLHGRSMVPTFDDPGGTRAPRDAVLRDVRQPRHLPQGLDRGDPPQHPVEADRDAGLRRRRLGAVRAGRLDPGPRPVRRTAREAPRAPAAVPDRGGPLQRAPARRPPLRALQPRHGRAPAARQGQVAAAVRGNGPAVRELGARRSRTSRTPSRRRSRCRRAAPRG